MRTPGRLRHSSEELRVTKVAVLAGSIGMMASLSGDEMLRVLIVLGSSGHQLQIVLGFFACLIACPALLAPLAGNLVDRFHNRPQLTFNCISSAALLASGAMWLTWGKSSLAIYVGGFTAELAALATAIAWQSYVADFARHKSNASRAIVARTATVLAVGPLLGPAIIAILASYVSLRTLVIGDAVTCILSIVLIGPALAQLNTYRRSIAPSETARETRKATLWSGIGLVLRSDLVRAPVCILAVSNSVAYLALFVLPALVLMRTGSAAQAASATAVELFAGLTGALIGGLFTNVALFRLYIVIEPMVRALGLIVIAFSQTLFMIFVGIVVFAFPQGVARTARAWLVNVAFESGQRGRANGGYRFLARVMMPVLPLLTTLVAPRHLEFMVFLGGAAMMLLSSTIPLLDARFRYALKHHMLSETA